MVIISSQHLLIWLLTFHAISVLLVLFVFLYQSFLFCVFLFSSFCLHIFLVFLSLCLFSPIVFICFISSVPQGSPPCQELHSPSVRHCPQVALAWAAWGLYTMAVDTLSVLVRVAPVAVPSAAVSCGCSQWGHLHMYLNRYLNDEPLFLTCKKFKNVEHISVWECICVRGGVGWGPGGVGWVFYKM